MVRLTSSSFEFRNFESRRKFCFRFHPNLSSYTSLSFEKDIGSLLQTCEEDKIRSSREICPFLLRTTSTLSATRTSPEQVEDSSSSLARNFPLALAPSFQLSISPPLHSSSPDYFPRPYTTQFSSASTPVYLIYLPALPFYHNVSSSLPTRNYPPHHFFRFRLSFQQPSIVYVTPEHYSITLLSSPKLDSYRSGGITEGSLG